MNFLPLAFALALLAMPAAADTTTPGGACGNTLGGPSAPGEPDYILGSTGMGSGCATVTKGLASKDGQFAILLYPGPGVADHGIVTFYDRRIYPGSHPYILLTAGNIQPPYAGGTFKASRLPPWTDLQASYCNEAMGDAAMEGSVVGQPGPQIMVFWRLMPGQQLIPGNVYAIFGQVSQKNYDPEFFQ